MTVEAASVFDGERPALHRWLLSALAVVLAHGLVVFALLPRLDEADPDAGSPAAYIELAPVTAAPESTPEDLEAGPPQPEAEQRDRIDAAEKPRPEETPIQTPEDRTESAEAPPVEQPPKVEPRSAEQQTPVEASTAMAPPEAAEQSRQAAAPAAGHTTRQASAADLRWQRSLIAHLERSKHYPREASGHSGVTRLLFSIDRRGNLLASRIVESSGNAMLDAESLATARRAAPFPPPPEDIAEDKLSFVVPIRYESSFRH